MPRKSRELSTTDEEPPRFVQGPPSLASPGRPGRGFAIYRIAVNLAPGTVGYVVTHGRPEVRAEVTNRMELENGLLLLEGRVFGLGAAELTSLVKDHPMVRRIEIYPENDRSVFYRLRVKLPVLWEVLRRHKILTRYPVVYEDGWMRFETLAPAQQIRQLVRDLRREVGPSRVEAVRQGSVSPSALGLSPPQLVVFRTALAAGYFAFPRKTSVTKLAHQLGRSKSTVSEQLALIQHRLAESALRLKWEPVVAS
jgi:predicted DNA binding protein